MKFGAMKPQRRNRLMVVGLVIVSAGVAVSLALSALNENINLFYSPARIANGEAPVDQLIRAGGMVLAGSVKRSTTDLRVSFVVSDMQAANVTVQYTGILPDLFREGQGVVARGRLNEQGVFMAEEVLAKHDENYMPPEVLQTMEQSRAAAQAAGSADGSGSYASSGYEKASYSGGSDSGDSDSKDSASQTGYSSAKEVSP